MVSNSYIVNFDAERFWKHIAERIWEHIALGVPNTGYRITCILLSTSLHNMIKGTISGIF